MWSTKLQETHLRVRSTRPADTRVHWPARAQPVDHSPDRPRGARSPNARPVAMRFLPTLAMQKPVDRQAETAAGNVLVFRRPQDRVFCHAEMIVDRHVDPSVERGCNFAVGNRETTLPNTSPLNNPKRTTPRTRKPGVLGIVVDKLVPQVECRFRVLLNGAQQ